MRIHSRSTWWLSFEPKIYPKRHHDYFETKILFFVIVLLFYYSIILLRVMILYSYITVGKCVENVDQNNHKILYVNITFI